MEYFLFLLDNLYHWENLLFYCLVKKKKYFVSFVSDINFTIIVSLSITILILSIFFLNIIILPY